MLKRVERKRKRREEDEELGLDQLEDMRGTMGLNDTDSDDSESDLEHQKATPSEDEDSDTGEDRDQEEDVVSEDEGVSEDPPISVAEALKNPIYLISFNPTVHGCVLCKGKLIKNTGMATAHQNANTHKRRLERFRMLSADADPRSNAWELVSAIRPASNVQTTKSQELSKRASKRQVKQAAVREKRKRHKELRAKAIVKKPLEKLSTAVEERPAAPSSTSMANSRSSPESNVQPGKPRKKKKLESNTPTNETRKVSVKSAASRIRNSGGNKKKAPNLRSRGA